MVPWWQSRVAVGEPFIYEPRGLWQTAEAMTSRAGDGRSMNVVWTRGEGCRELAELLGTDASRVQGDPVAACVEARADLMVSRKLQSSFDLVDVAVPLGVDPAGVDAVVAAVAGGPHSVLAARIAHRLGSALGVKPLVVLAHPRDAPVEDAIGVVEDIVGHVPDIDYQTLPTADMGELVSSLPGRSLLVLGAPGGSWFQRRLFGPGAKLRSQAPAGAVMVQAAPRRVFQEMGAPVFVAPLLHARDTLRMRQEATLAVAEAGRLVGLVRRSRLAQLRPDTPVAEAMEDPVSIGHVEPVAAARPLGPLFGPDPIPVVDEEYFLVGGLVLPAA